MSQNYDKEIKCYYCEKSFQKTIWQNINTSKTPELKEPLLSGKLFLNKCPHCGRPVMNIYSLLYHDPALNLMIYFAASQSDIQEAIHSLDTQQISVTKRIVNNLATLREKNLIFSNNLDDRVIECLKVFASHQIPKNNPNDDLKPIFLTECETAYKFETFDGSISAFISINSAENLIKLITKHLPAKNSDYFIDTDWALSFLTENTNILADSSHISPLESTSNLISSEGKESKPKIIQENEKNKSPCEEKTSKQTLTYEAQNIAIKQLNQVEAKSKLSYIAYVAVKIIIWIGVPFFLYGFPVAILKLFDIQLGAIPTIILASIAFGATRYISKKWTKHKNAQAEPLYNTNQINNIQEKSITAKKTDDNITHPTISMEHINIQSNNTGLPTHSPTGQMIFKENSKLFFDSIPKSVLLTKDNKIVHTDSTMEHLYGKYTVFVDKNHLLLHKNKSCCNNTDSFRSYCLLDEYKNYNLCPSCWSNTNKNAFSDLFYPEWYNTIQRLLTDVIVFDSVDNKNIDITEKINKIFKSDTYIDIKLLADIPLLLIDLKNHIVVDCNKRIYHLDSISVSKYGKYTLLSENRVAYYHTTPHRYTGPTSQVPSYIAFENPSFSLCKTCSKRFSDKEYNELVSPRWYNIYKNL